MPSWSGVGNISPLSTTTIDPSYSTTVMFLPISPRPPSGRTRSRATLDGAQQAVPLEHGSDLRLLLVARLDERQAQAAHIVSEHVQRRLERDRARGEGHQRVDHVRDLTRDLVPLLGLVDHAPHL